MKKYLLAASSVAAMIIGATHAQAAGIDYGSLEQLFGEPVTTSATGQPQRATDVPANMEIITADQIRRSGANTLPDVLRNVAGMDVRQYSLGDTEVSVRGYATAASPRLLVLINGRQVYDDVYGFTTWASLPVQLSEIRQIEVVKGPNTALFGFNAVGGVINIITFDPLHDNTKSGSVTVGTQGEIRGSGVMTFHLDDDLGVKISGGAYRANEFNTQSLPYYHGRFSDSRGQNLSTAATYDISTDTELTGEATWSQDRQFEPVASGQGSMTDYTTYSFKAGATSDTSLGLVSLDAYRNQVSFVIHFPTLTLPVSNTIYVAQANDLIKLGTDNIVRIGVEYRHNDGSSNWLFNDSHVGETLGAVSAMWNWQIDPDLSLTNAVRVDHTSLYLHGEPPFGAPYTTKQFSDTTKTEFSFNSGAVYKASDDDTVRATVGRGIQAPSLVAYGAATQAQVTPFPAYYYGNPDLKSAIVMNYELDYDRRLDDLSSVLRVAAYHQDTTNMFAASFMEPFQAVPFGAASQSQNIGSSHATGGEIQFKGASASGWRWDASYALINISDDLNINKGAISAPYDFAHGTPTSVITVGGGFSWDRLEADATLRWQSNYTDVVNQIGSLADDAIGSYATVEGRVGYRLTDNITAAVSVQQLNEASIAETGLVPTERRVFATLSFNP